MVNAQSALYEFRPWESEQVPSHYTYNADNIGMHFDKPISIEKESLITIVKTGEHGRPFRLEMLDGSVIMERVLAPGTAVIMTLEANLLTQHGVPEVSECGPSGSWVARTIASHSGSYSN